MVDVMKEGTFAGEEVNFGQTLKPVFSHFQCDLT